MSSDHAGHISLVDRHHADALNSVHRWYRIIMGFDPDLVRELIGDFEIGPRHLVLDPFCGAGTTLLECKAAGIQAIGIDANPICTWASRVKTRWFDERSLTQVLPIIVRRGKHLAARDTTGERDRSILEIGAQYRGWITPSRFRKVVAIDAAIRETCTNDAHRDF